MKCSRRSSLALGVLLTLICVGCASYPEAELKQAQEAMDKATALQSEIYAASNWQEAKKAWDEAQADLSQQKYAPAATALARAKSRFEKAESIARANRDVVESEVRIAQRTANSRFVAMKNEFAAARLPAPVRKELEGCCQELEQQVEKLNSSVAAGDLVTARTTAKETLSKIYDAELKLQAATKKR